jgi:catechol 2,3-dioxygenase-like lactoylglutathione lyase family enzyme
MTDLKPVGQIAVNVHDVKRAVALYRNILGMKLPFEIPNAAFFDCGGARLMLSLAEKPEFQHPASIIYYKVADLQAAFQSLSLSGAPLEGEPHLIARMPDHDLWMGFFRDSEGNRLALMSEVPRG